MGKEIDTVEFSDNKKYAICSMHISEGEYFTSLIKIDGIAAQVLFESKEY